MLLDPLVLHGLYTAPTFTTGLPNDFRRIAIGRYVSINGQFTLDQPARIAIVPNIKPSGISTILARVEGDYNLSPVNGVTQSDDTVRVELKLSGNLRSMTSARAKMLLDIQYNLLSSNLDRILSGES